MNAPFLRIDDFESKKSDRVLFYFPNELINFKRYWMNIKQASLTIASIGLLPFGPLVAQEEILVDALIGIGPKGKGNDQAVEAWVEVPKLTASSIPNLLKAMNEANDLGDNWIRGAVSQILSQKMARCRKGKSSTSFGTPIIREAQESLPLKYYGQKS